jgi:Cd2+/Zn2+-exporting ATPase
MEHVAAQAVEYGHSRKREMAYLVVHSVLHLLGYDHLDEGPQKRQMRAREEAILAELGITRVFSRLLPGDKVTRVEQLLQQKPRGSCVAFVGDGINDAPVLARADIGIAMGALGSDAAIEAADIVLMDDDPRKLSTAIGISRKTMRIARQNIAFALGIKAAVLLLAALGIANMWLAVFADVGVSILAVLNAMRTLRYRENHPSSK